MRLCSRRLTTSHVSSEYLPLPVVSIIRQFYFFSNDACLLGAFAYYAPKLYRYYVKTLIALYGDDPDNEPPYRGSVYPNQTRNPSKAVAYMHNDHCNLAFG